MLVNSAQRAHLGFTLLELLIVVSILTIISGLTIPNFNTYIRNQNLRQAQEQVISDLRSVQSKALNGVDYTDTTTYWVVKFDSSDTTQYYYYTSTLAPGSTQAQFDTACGVDAPAGSERSQILPAGAVIKNTGDKCFFFSFENGNATSAGNNAAVFIGYPDSTGSACIGVRANTPGLIYPDDSVNCP